MPLIVALFLLLQFTGNWYLTDRLGSITGITDNTGTLINSTTYDSYGHILSQSNPAVADQLTFTGREFDAETGLYYFRARYYNPDLGRFQSEDQIANKIVFAKQVQGTNPFAYLAAAGSSSDGSPNAMSQMQPTPFAAGDFNISRYVLNNPTGYLDSQGLDAAVETKLIDVTEKGAFKVFFVVNRYGKLSTFLAYIYFRTPIGLVHYDTEFLDQNFTLAELKLIDLINNL